MSSSSGSVSSSRRRAAIWAALALFALGGSSGTAQAKVFLSQNAALALAFPDADEITDEITILSASQVERIQSIAKSELESEIVKLYTGWKDGEVLGYAYIDVHTVRTLPEAFLVVLSPDGSVKSLRVLAFYEPLDYMPSERWYQQFDGVQPGAVLRLGREIHGITGATLSARAVTASVRRVQALYQVLVVPERERDRVATVD
jgi:Na+-translocating ferredoxin:NAD+ oxidoreductase RnfG subunit